VPCAQAQSVNTASVIFIRFPLRVVSPLEQAAPTKQSANQRRPIAQRCGNAFAALEFSVQRIALRRRLRCYFFLPDATPGCHPAAFWLGAAAIVLIFSFLGFLASRFPLCSPLAISISFGWMLTPSLHAEFHIVA
jgi:hypothetical protein